MQRRSTIPRGKWTPLRVLFDRWLMRAYHLRNIMSMESFLRDVDKQFKRGEISEEKMQRLVAEKVALNSKRRVKTIQAGDSKFYDEGIIFEDVCARYRTWTTWYQQNCSVEIVLCSRSVSRKGEKLWMNATYVVEFTNDISARRFYIAFRNKRQRCPCEENVDYRESKCWLDVSVRHETETSVSHILGRNWGAEPGELFQDLAGTRLVMSSESDRVVARRKIALLKQRTREHETRRAAIENSVSRIQGAWIRHVNIKKARAALKTRKRNRKKRSKRKRNREKERLRVRNHASRVLQRWWKTCVPHVRHRRRCVAIFQERWKSRSNARRQIRSFLRSHIERVRFLRFCDALRSIQYAYRRRFVLKSQKENKLRNSATSPRGRCFHVVPTEISLAMVMPPETRLTKEIREFSRCMQRLVKLMKPSHHQTMTEIRRVIQSIFPCAMIKLYGSCATKLALPSSDLDLVVLHRHRNDVPCSNVGHSKRMAATCLLDTPNPAEQLHLIRLALLREPWASGIKLVGTTMPLLKLNVSPFEMLSSYQGPSAADHKIDISSGCARGHSGTHAVSWIEKQVELRPILRPLLLVLKQYTRESGVADTWTGGIGSFTLSLLLIRLLQHNELRTSCSSSSPTSPPRMGENEEISRVLLQFFKFYGNEFDCSTTGISVYGHGAYFSLRSSYSENFVSSPTNSPCLVVLSPLKDQVDLGIKNVASGVYRFPDVQRAFARGYDTLIHSFQNYMNGKTETLLRSLLRIQWGAGGQRKVLLEKMRRSLMMRHRQKLNDTTGTTSTTAVTHDEDPTKKDS